MKRITLLVIGIIALYLPNIYASTIDISPLEIPNLCEKQYPTEARNGWQTQYILAFDRCQASYTLYANTLKQGVSDWKLASKSQKKEDWDKAEGQFRYLWEIVNLYGVTLAWWSLEKDVMILRVQEYTKKVREHVLFEEVWTSPEKDTTSQTWTLLQKKIQNTSICKPWFIENKRTGKCRKILIRKV